MVIYVPGTEETDPKKQNMALQQIAAAATTAIADVATNTANITTNTTAIATNAAATATSLATKVDLAGNQTITGGYKLTPKSLGNLSGAFTPDPTQGNYQYGTNHGAITFNVPANDCAIDILITNDATAGAITFFGFQVSALGTGDPLNTVNGQIFCISIRRIAGVSFYVIKRVN